jgi:hypothetical protein
MIRFACNCGKVIEVDDAMGGKWGACPSCKARVQVPTQSQFIKRAVPKDPRRKPKSRQEQLNTITHTFQKVEAPPIEKFGAITGRQQPAQGASGTPRGQTTIAPGVAGNDQPTILPPTGGGGRTRVRTTRGQTTVAPAARPAKQVAPVSGGKPASRATSAVAGAAPGSRPIPNFPNARVCWNQQCGAANKPIAKYCRRCGLKLK